MRRRHFLTICGIAAASLSLTGCKIVSLDQDAANSAANAFSAADYADDLWASKALPFFESEAHPVDEVLDAIAIDLTVAGDKFGYRPSDEGSPWSFVVTGTGTVLAKNTKSRAGSLTVKTQGSAQHELAIQIGPVVRGNTTRDALPFVSFKDFTNQLEFADVGSAFTALAMAAVVSDVDAIEEGSEVSFVGTMSLNSKSDKIVVTPVVLKRQ